MKKIVSESFNDFINENELPRGFSQDPQKEIDDASKDNFKTYKQLGKLLDRYIANEEHVLEMMTQMQMMGDNTHEPYIGYQKEWVEELRNIEFKMRKGVW